MTRIPLLIATLILMLVFSGTSVSRPDPVHGQTPGIPVVGGVASPPWTDLGSQRVTGDTWNFDGQDYVDASATFLRVRAGGCEGEPGAFTMEANLQREGYQDVGAGLDVWDGLLHLTGTAAGVDSAVGHAQLSRPVTLNPLTQIDVTLFGLTGVLRGANLHVCVRTP
jgi:hypothetical protein